MSAQSSARSKRRQSALFSSHGRPSLLPLPQISISSIVTSTPARGLQKHVPAFLPTPQPTSTQLLGTPARGYDDNTTFFGFSPGAEADETALLAVDYRSVGQHDDVAREEQLHDELFETTAILEQKAFSNRRTSHEGDQSVGGLGALIFSNLLANGQTTNALERLELGKRRDSETSRRSDHFSPIKRNASFTFSTGGEYLVDYETDVRFGDDLLEGGSNAASAASSSSPAHQQVLQDEPPQLYNFGSSPFARGHTPTSLALSPSRSAPETAYSALDSEDLPATSNPDLPEAAIQAAFPASPSSMISERHYVDQESAEPQTNDREEMNDAVSTDVPIYQSPSKQRSSPVIAFKSPANTIASVHVTLPSPASEERRQARRKRRGLTASMAVMLSPVVEDRDKERSISRSRSMLVEAVESRDLQNDWPQTKTSAPAHYNLHEPSQILRNDVSEVSQKQVHTQEPEHATPHSPIGLLSVQTVNSPQAPVSLASILSGSLSQEISVPIQLTRPVVSTAPTHSVEAAPAQSLRVRKQRLADSKKSATSSQTKSTAAPTAQQQDRSSASTRAGPSYLKPTLSRSIQQRESIPARPAASTSRRKLDDTASLKRNPAPIRPPRPPKGAPHSAPSQRPATIVSSRGFSAPTVSSSRSIMVPPIAKQQDGSVGIFQSEQNSRTMPVHVPLPKPPTKQAASDPRSLRTAALPDASTSAALTATEVSMPVLDDAGLTVPKGFAFGQSRKRVRQEGAAPAPAAAPQRLRRTARTVPPTGPAVRKARRVLPEENERIADGDPEVGPSISLTASALAIQEKSFARDDSEAAAPTALASFDKTTHSQMLERYLRELADIDADHLFQQQLDKGKSGRLILSASEQQQESRQHVKSTQDREVEAEIEVDEPQPKRARLAASRQRDHAREEQNQQSQHTSVAKERQDLQHTRAPLQRIPTDRTNRVKVLAAQPIKATIVKQAPPQSRPVPNVNACTVAPKAGPAKVTDFTFKVVGQQQTTFQERLAAWQAREAEAARAGKSIIQPLALPSKDPAKQARKADKVTSSKRKSPVKAREFNWHSDKRARERKDFEDRLREKEQILAELAEIRRLEAEAAEIEAVRKMRAAQVPRAHAVPAFVRSRKRA